MKALLFAGFVLFGFSVSAHAEEPVRKFTAAEKYKIILNILASRKADSTTKRLLSNAVNNDASQTTLIKRFSCYSDSKSLKVGCELVISSDDLTNDNPLWMTWNASVLLLDNAELTIRKATAERAED